MFSSDPLAIESSWALSGQASDAMKAVFKKDYALLISHPSHPGSEAPPHGSLQDQPK